MVSKFNARTPNYETWLSGANTTPLIGTEDMLGMLVCYIPEVSGVCHGSVLP